MKTNTSVTMVFNGRNYLVSKIKNVFSTGYHYTVHHNDYLVSTYRNMRELRQHAKSDFKIVWG